MRLRRSGRPSLIAPSPWMINIRVRRLLIHDVREELRALLGRRPHLKLCLMGTTSAVDGLGHADGGTG